MNKIIFAFALCMASAIAMPSKTMTARADWGKCISHFQDQATQELENMSAAASECSTDSAEELVALKAELMESFGKGTAAVREQMDVFNNCEDIACKIATIKTVADIVTQKIKESIEIVKKHLAVLEEKFPEAGKCFRVAFIKIGMHMKAHSAEFVNCVKGSLFPKSIVARADWGKCATTLQKQVTKNVEKLYVNVLECSADCVEEFAALEAELLESIGEAYADIEEQLNVVDNCGEDEICKIDALKDVAGIILQNIHDNTEITKEHLNDLEEEFPEAAQCARTAFVGMRKQLKAHIVEFVSCIKS